MARPYSISPGLAIKLAKLYAEGKGLPELMRMTGKSQGAVTRAIVRQGVKMREPGRPSRKGPSRKG